MEQLGDLIQSIKDIIKNNPSYFVLLVIVLALLYPVYQQIVQVEFDKYLIFSVFVMLTSLVFLLLFQTPRQAQRMKNELVGNFDSLERKIESIFRRYNESGIVLLDLERRQLDEYYLTHIENTKKIDIIAFSGETFTRLVRNLKRDRDIRFDKLKKRILDGECRIRVLLLKSYTPSPESELDKTTNFLWNDRANRDVRDIVAWNKSVEPDKEFWISFKEEIEKDYKTGMQQGGITIKYHCYTPCYAYFRADDIMAIGLYFYFKSGKDSPTFEITQESSPKLYTSFKEDFRSLWSQSRHMLIQLSQDSIYPQD